MRKIPSFWITGTAVALVGVAVARFVAPALEENGGNVALIVKTLGHIVAFVGIFIVARGISKRRADDGNDE